MIIGIPKEIKDGEFRVAITPSNVGALENKHKVSETAGNKPDFQIKTIWLQGGVL